MKKQLADKTIMSLVKSIYGFALSKTNDSYAAEDLAGRVILEVYESLINKDDVRDCRAYSIHLNRTETADNKPPFLVLGFQLFIESIAFS